MRRRASRLSVLPLAAACLALAVWLGGQWHDEHRLAGAGAAVTDGRIAHASALLDGLRGGEVDGPAHRLRALVALREGDLPRATDEMGRAVGEAPNDWSLRADHAVLLRRLGRREQAAREMAVALGLNPRMPLPAGFRR